MRLEVVKKHETEVEEVEAEKILAGPKAMAVQLVADQPEAVKQALVLVVPEAKPEVEERKIELVERKNGLEEKGLEKAVVLQVLVK